MAKAAKKDLQNLSWNAAAEKVKYIYSVKCEQAYNEDRKRRKLLKLKIA